MVDDLERYHPSLGGRLRHEHLHRYAFAQAQVSGLEVLDAACGTGYGTAMLGQAARRVVGLDVCATAISQARTDWPDSHLAFEQGDCAAMPFADASFDVVVSFETIEHLREQHRFLAEIRRVLRPGGLLLISTPDRVAYSKDQAGPNPFHLHELDLAEFEALLREHFGIMEIMGQRFVLGSAILPRGRDEAGLIATIATEAGGLTLSKALPSAEGASFLIARCSDTALPAMVPAASLFLDHGEDLWPETTATLRWASGLHGEYVAMQARALAAEAQLAAPDPQLLAALAEIRAEAAARRGALEDKLAEQSSAIRALGIQTAEGQAALEVDLASLRQEQAARDAATAATLPGTMVQILAGEMEALRGWVAELRAAETTTQRRQGRRLLRRLLPRLARLGAAPPAALAREPLPATWPEIEEWQAPEQPVQSPEREHLAPELLGYWLPQRLRDHLLEHHAPAALPLVERLMAVVARYAKDQRGFEATEVAQALIAEATAMADAQASETPDVSIIIPVYNNLPFTLTCIVSLLATTTRRSFEILVGDDRSTDGTEAAIGAIGGNVRLVRHATNLGFLRNCNRAAEQARGRFVVFLNNDTVVLPGWLDGLIDVFADHAQAGLSGSKLLNSDGTLQEAGGIFWADGSAWNFGRGGNPRAPEFNYVKPVDYISGASIALPTALWRALGGFDRLFSPAYCEDSDLAFRVRAAGKQVLYTPRSELIHHEGQSHGTDTSAGVKRFQTVNSAKLQARWGGVLAADNLPNGVDVEVARDRSRDRRHILIIDHYVPQRDRDAGSRTIFDFTAMFARAGFQVHFWPDNLYEDVSYVRELQRMGVEVIYSSAWVGRFGDWLRAHGNHLDAVLLSRPHIAEQYMYDIRATAPDAQLLYYGHDLHWKRLENEAAATGDEALLREAETTQALERAVFREADILLYPSEEEAVLVRQAAPEGRVCLAVPAYHFSPAALEAGRARAAQITTGTGGHLLFVGGFAHRPNVDGILWFAREVMPLLPDGVRLSIIGSKAPAEVEALAGSSVAVLGFLSDAELAALYETCDAVVAPLRFGAGVKGKVIEAFVKGVPVVATSVGLQGIAGADGFALRADEPAAFAAAVVTVLREREAAAARARAALEFVAWHYSAAAMQAILAPHMPALAGGLAA